MKLSIIGAAGVRTPLIIEEIINRQEEIGINELCLVDIDSDRLELISAVTSSRESHNRLKFRITQTTDPVKGLDGADYVITTFRVGGMESRVIDEKVPLELGILGQETTGPGGFAMGLRSIPVLANYVRLLQRYCPHAWLINFANPSGMLTEAMRNYVHFEKVIGICDGPVSIIKAISKYLNVPISHINPVYFGLNHLGWFKSIIVGDTDILPDIIQMVIDSGGVPGLDISPEIVESLKMIPNEYLFYYYHSRKAVNNMAKSGITRGEKIVLLNNGFFAQIREQYQRKDPASMRETYLEYLRNRNNSYMANETRRNSADLEEMSQSLEIGYAEIALDLIESLSGGKQKSLVLNIPNEGAITGMNFNDIVEIPALVTRKSFQRIQIGAVPDQCLGLMKQIKAFEKLTIEAALEGSYKKAVMALTIHPLIEDFDVARKILKGYMDQHGPYFPPLS